jgi:hypothetical protein
MTVSERKVEWSSAAHMPEAAGMPDMMKGAIIEDGREVSSTLLMTQTIRIGCARLRAGIVGHVFTAEDQRGKGLAGAVMASAIERMAAQGNHIAFLLGIPSYYTRFGYVTVEHYYATLLACRGAPHGVRGASVREYRKEDIGAVMAIHALDNRYRTGSFIRSREVWTKGPVTRGLNSCVVTVDSRDRLCGYALYAGEGFFFTRLMAGSDFATSLVVQEAGVRNQAASDALLAHLYTVAAARKLQHILFLGPPDHPLSQAMYERGGQFRKAVVPDNGGAQARFVRFNETFAGLAKEFTRRCCAAVSLPARTSVSIATDMGSVRLSWDGRRIICTQCRRPYLRMSSQDLIRHIFGFMPPPEHDSPAGALLKALFPLQYAHTWPHDEMI